ncbi:hypothetical protein HDU78_006448 [Chytriomyces hyalinus]|nr:hypothetical protein HDU78_006448 [Chytriomyces hyalinus]
MASALLNYAQLSGSSDGSQEEFYRQERVAVVVETGITMGSSVIQLILFGIIIFRERRGLHWKAFTAPINLLLLSMITSNCAQFAFFYLKKVTTSDSTSQVLYLTMNEIMIACLQTGIVVYSWYRGLPVIEIVLPVTVKPLTWTVYLYPAIQLARVGLCIAAMDKSSSHFNRINAVRNVVFIIGDVIMVFFDMFVLTCYLKYLRRTAPMDYAAMHINHLKILARYGVCSGVLAIFWFSSFFVSYFVPVNPLSPMSVLFIINWGVYRLVSTVFLFIQLSMKFSLLRSRGQESEEKKKVVEDAKRQTSDSVGGGYVGGTGRKTVSD